VTAEILLEVKDLQVAYGHVEAVRGISLAVPARGLVTLIGPNGAGKTSILSALVGLVRPRAGMVRLGEEDVTGLASHRAVAKGLTLVPEGRAILGRMTVEENLLLAGERRQERGALLTGMREQYERFPVLGARRRELAGRLSGGEQQMLAFARALLAKPKVLLLDEPSMGLSPILVEQVFATIEAIHESGTSAILLVEQNARLALAIADYGYVLERGEVVLEGEARLLAKDERLEHAYLGGPPR
jgi:branched-chain amino acid transport system ATP-binding protein